MFFPASILCVRRWAITVAMVAPLVGVGVLSMPSDRAHAQDAEPTADSEKRAPKPKKHPAKKPTPVVEAPAARPAVPVLQPVASTPLQAPLFTSAAGTAPASDIAAQIRGSGAGTCAAEVDSMANGVMGGVNRFNTASSSATTRGDKRIVIVSIGQRYADGTAMPYGAVSILAAPNGQGSCDSVAVHVRPSPLPCEKLRDELVAGGKQIGDLAGVLLVQDAGGQAMLVPAAANTCVLVGLKAAYAR